MKKKLVLPTACLVLAIGGCASTGQMRKVEATGEDNQRVLRETDQRLHNLENSVAALNSQVALLNNRVYEVRTRSGHKTGMTVVPIIPPQTARHTTPASSPQSAAMPHGDATGGKTPPVVQGGPAVASAKKIDPAAPPAPFPGGTPSAKAEKGGEKPVGPSGQVGRPEAVAGPSGQLAAVAAPGGLALPPTEAPSTPAEKPVSSSVSGDKGAPQVAPSAGGTASVPVPTLPPSDLALPPEHPGLPPVDAPSASAVPASPAASPAPGPAATGGQPTAPSKPAESAKGEEAAYKAALKVALSGHSAEGISRFREFLQQYPQGRYAANAEYWIGECLYAQGNYKEALAQFQTVNTNHPRHHKNADALLKAGMSLSRLGDKPGAAQKYRTLLADFPNSEAARMARSRGLAR